MAQERSNEDTIKYIAALETADTEKKLQKFFDDWAPTYDQSITSLGYIGHTVAAECLHKLVLSKSAHILDVASGTGLVGEELHSLGYTNIDALDGSEKSMEIARGKNIYNKLFVEWIGGDHKLSMSDGTYDAVICVGGFAINNMKSDSFPELIRILKPGGYSVITMRSRWLSIEPSYCDGKLEADMEKQEKDGRWKLVEKFVNTKENNEQSVVTWVHQIC